MAGAFDSASRRAQAAADAAALEISTLRKMLDKAKEEERRQGPFISPGPKTSATDCGVSQPWPDVDGGGSSEARGQDGRHGSCQPARRTAASASGGGVAREPCASRGEAGTCAGEASARDRLQPPPSDSSPRIGGRYWRRLTAATAERIEDKQAAEQSPPRADHARALSPMLCRGSSPGFSVSFQGRVACFGGKRVPAGCSPWERGGGASARMLAPPDGPERRERAQAGWTK